MHCQFTFYDFLSDFYIGCQGRFACTVDGLLVLADYHLIVRWSDHRLAPAPSRESNLDSL